jgi:hypothetical protein
MSYRFLSKGSCHRFGSSCAPAGRYRRSWISWVRAAKVTGDRVAWALSIRLGRRRKISKKSPVVTLRHSRRRNGPAGPRPVGPTGGPWTSTLPISSGSPGGGRPR